MLGIILLVLRFVSWFGGSTTTTDLWWCFCCHPYHDTRRRRVHRALFADTRKVEQLKRLHLEAPHRRVPGDQVLQQIFVAVLEARIEAT